MSLWGKNGEHVGIFGDTTWDIDDRLTWKVAEPQKLEVRLHISILAVSSWQYFSVDWHPTFRHIKI